MPITNIDVSAVLISTWLIGGFVSVCQWLFSKMILRFLIITAIVWISLILTLAINGVSLFQESGMVKLLLITRVYIFFWFIVSLIVSAFRKSSGANAVIVISIWVVFVLIMPAVISQTANSIYLVPSRINMINEMRVANARASKESDKILKGFFKYHPEFAPQDTSVQNKYEYYLRFFASQDVVRNELRPVIERFEQKLETQQSWVESFRFISPSPLLQSAFNDLAGTSSRKYGSYCKQVLAFSEEWRNYFLPRMFRNETMKQADLASLPSFSFDYTQVKLTFIVDFIGILFFALIGFLVSAFVYQQYGREVLLADRVIVGLG